MLTIIKGLSFFGSLFYLFLLSSNIVTGPSLSNFTFISAPNIPVSIFKGVEDLKISRNLLYSACAKFGGRAYV